MTQLLQSVYALAPLAFVVVLFVTVGTGIWLIFQLKGAGHSDRFPIGERLFLKRNASRFRKMQLH